MASKYKYERVKFTFNGKRYECYGKTLKEAHAKAAKKLLDLERGELEVSGDMTVSRWMDEWLETYKRPQIGEGQYMNYAAFRDGVINPIIGRRSLKDIKDIDLQKMLNSRAGKSKSTTPSLAGHFK